MRSQTRDMRERRAGSQLMVRTGPRRQDPNAARDEGAPRGTQAVMRAALLVTAVLVLAAPAQAQERLCQPPATPPRAPTAAEKKRAELEVSAARRAEFGFRHDLP